MSCTRLSHRLYNPAPLVAGLTPLLKIPATIDSQGRPGPEIFIIRCRPQAGEELTPSTPISPRDIKGVQSLAIEARIIRLRSGGAEALPRGDPEAEACPTTAVTTTAVTTTAVTTTAVTQICETQ